MSDRTWIRRINSSKRQNAGVFREYILQEDVSHEQDRISSCSCRTGQIFQRKMQKALKAFVDVVKKKQKGEKVQLEIWNFRSKRKSCKRRKKSTD